MNVTNDYFVRLPDELFYEILKKSYKKEAFTLSQVAKRYFQLISKRNWIPFLGESFTVKKIFSIGLSFGISDRLSLEEMIVKQVLLINNLVGSFKSVCRNVLIRESTFQEFHQICSSRCDEWFREHVYELFNKNTLDCSYIKFLYLIKPREVEWLNLVIESQNSELFNLMLSLKPDYNDEALVKMITLKWDIESIHRLHALYCSSISTAELTTCIRIAKEQNIPLQL